MKRQRDNFFRRLKAGGYPGALQTALLYGLFAGLWIVYSDRLLVTLAADDIALLATLQTWKGLLFVSVTMLLVFILVRQTLIEQNRLIQKLRDNQQRLRLILNTVPSGIQECDVDGRITYSNLAHHRILGYPPGGLIGRHIWDFHVDPAEQQGLKTHFADLVALQPAPEAYITTNRKLNGEQVSLEVSWDYIRNNDQQLTGFIAVISDITERKQQQDKILQLALYDTLTSLPNRFLALDRLDHMVLEARRKHQLIAVLFLDLDNFKKINDSLGHEAGDKLLRQVAERLRKCVRDADTVGRLGGDEFILLLSGLQKTAAVTAIVETVLNTLRRPFELDGNAMQLTASIGVATYPGDGDSASQLLRHADMAMFDAKDNGRNSFAFFTPAMNARATRRMQLEQQMQEALDRQEFYLVYQPQLDLLGEKIVGAEALLRWSNPELGEVPPDEFIEVAEQSGQILEIGRFVIVQAMAACARFQQQQPGFRMALNLSPVQFRDPELLDCLVNTLRDNGLTAEAIEIEITEGVLMSATDQVSSLLDAMLERGFRLAMDDFGTGYSSLSYLRLHPFTSLKIDRSFISDMTGRQADYELVNAAIAMAHGLGLDVVAEGVETVQQLKQLQLLDCDYGQGYLFSRPIRAEALQSMLAQGVAPGFKRQQH